MMSQQRQDSNGVPSSHHQQLPLGMSNEMLASAGQMFAVPLQNTTNLRAFQDFQSQAQAHSLLMAQQQASRLQQLNPDIPNYDLSSMATSAHGMNTTTSTTVLSRAHEGNQRPEQTERSQSAGLLPGNVQIKQEMCPSSPNMPHMPYNTHTSPNMQFPKGLDVSSDLASYAGGITKHICQVCGDKASGKHYGVYSCEGCKGFFKRTVRKDLTYNCRDNKDCVIDKRQRNRCQYCRYHKCLHTGMKREAVQEERQKNKEDKNSDVSNPNDEMPVDRILQAEISSEPNITDIIDYSQSEQQDPVAHVCKAADRQLLTLVEWAKRVPHFNSLPIEDRVALLQTGWNELFIASFSHRSTTVTDGILLASGLHVQRDSANAAGVGQIFDRVLVELVSKMRDMKMDKTELGCLRAVVLYNPDVKALSDCSLVENLREKVYASLEAYCRLKYPDQPGRFAKLLLRLPALRSIGLKCMDHLFFFKLIGDTPIDKFICDMLETDSSEGENSINNQVRLQSASSNSNQGE